MGLLPIPNLRALRGPISVNFEDPHAILRVIGPRAHLIQPLVVSSGTTCSLSYKGIVVSAFHSW